MQLRARIVMSSMFAVTSPLFRAKSRALRNNHQRRWPRQRSIVSRRGTALRLDGTRQTRSIERRVMLS